MTKTYVVDQSFDVSVTTSYFLSIRSSSGGLSFSVLDPVTNTYLAYANIPFTDNSTDGIKTQEILLKEELLQMPYKKVFFLFESPYATLVPTALYDVTKHKEIFELNHSYKEEDVELVAQKIKMADAWNIFSIPRFMYHLVKTQFEQVSFYQQYSPFVETCMISRQNHPEEDIMHIDIHDKFFDLVVIGSRKLKLCNSYTYNNVNDFIYFVLFAFEQLKLSPDKTRVKVYGIHDRQNHLYKTLKNYLHQTLIAQPTQHFRFSDTKGIKESDKQILHNLFNLAICV